MLWDQLFFVYFYTAPFDAMLVSIDINWPIFLSPDTEQFDKYFHFGLAVTDVSHLSAEKVCTDLYAFVHYLMWFAVMTAIQRCYSTNGRLKETIVQLCEVNIIERLYSTFPVAFTSQSILLAQSTKEVNMWTLFRLVQDKTMCQFSANKALTPQPTDSHYFTKQVILCCLSVAL